VEFVMMRWERWLGGANGIRLFSFVFFFGEFVEGGSTNGKRSGGTIHLYQDSIRGGQSERTSGSTSVLTED
jgi:hypothetical protein